MYGKKIREEGAKKKVTGETNTKYFEETKPGKLKNVKTSECQVE